MERVRLADTTIEDRRSAYDWLYHSDYSNREDSPTDPPGSPIPSYDDFKKDYQDYFFNGSSPEKGRCYLIEKVKTGESVGMISYTSYHLRSGISEIDIWLKGRSYLGLGYGTEALRSLCLKLLDEFGYHTLIIRPYRKNVQAIKSYMKSGFEEVNNDPIEFYKDEYVPSLSNGDYGPGEDIFMVRKRRRNEGDA